MYKVAVYLMIGKDRERRGEGGGSQREESILRIHPSRVINFVLCFRSLKVPMMAGW